MSQDRDIIMKMNGVDYTTPALVDKSSISPAVIPDDRSRIVPRSIPESFAELNKEVERLESLAKFLETRVKPILRIPEEKTTEVGAAGGARVSHAFDSELAALIRGFHNRIMDASDRLSFICNLIDL